MTSSLMTGNTDIEDSLQRLDELTQEEARVASAELLKVTHSVDDKVTVVDDRVKPVKGVEDKVQDVYSEVQDVGDKVQGVDHQGGQGKVPQQRMVRLFLRSFISVLTLSLVSYVVLVSTFNTTDKFRLYLYNV